MNTRSLEACLDAESWAQDLALMTEDHVEGIKVFHEKHWPVFSGR